LGELLVLGTRYADEHWIGQILGQAAYQRSVTRRDVG
jgi:hypothetical protein